METVRGILAAHHTGISKPGLLAWARLRIDTTMTDAQLDEELARLGDEVVDVDGFLYLRDYVDPSRRPARAGAPASARAPERRLAEPSSAGDWTWSPPAPSRIGRGGGTWKLLGLVAFLWWLLSFVGGLVQDGAEMTPAPTATPTSSPTATPMPVPTPSIGDVVPWEAIAVGDCIVVPVEDTFGELRRVPCDTRHGGEVFALIDHPGPLSAYPDDSFASFATERCAPELEAWTAPEDRDALDLAWFYPTWEGWVEGDRQVTCYLVQANGSNMYSSYRAAKP
jgi:hypothetical protein